MAKKTYDAIVVGAGFGGSSCAGLLAKRGLEVLLVEKNARAGGKAMSLSRGGYTYTAWVVIGAFVFSALGSMIGGFVLAAFSNTAVSLEWPPDTRVKPRCFQPATSLRQNSSIT